MGLFFNVISVRFFIILFVLLLAARGLSAQGVKVTVMSDNTPLEYAYIFINDKYYGSSDSNGIISIRHSDITIGDTISASYVGTDRGAIVYSPENYGTEGIIITLISNLQLETIIVTNKDKSRQKLKSYVKSRYTNSWFMEYRGDYSIRKQGHNETTGSYLYAQLPEKYANYYKLNKLNIYPSTDTTGMSESIRRVINTTRNASLFSVQIKNMYGSAKGMLVTYKGKQNGFHVFLFVKPAFDALLGREDGFQSIIYVDEQTKEIVSATTSMLYLDGRTVEFSADYSTWKPKNTLGGSLIYPLRIEGEMSDDNTKIHFLIDNNKISRPIPTPIPRKDR